jgi:hypothetical protein
MFHIDRAHRPVGPGLALPEFKHMPIANQNNVREIGQIGHRQELGDQFGADPGRVAVNDGYAWPHIQVPAPSMIVISSWRNAAYPSRIRLAAPDRMTGRIYG